MNYSVLRGKMAEAGYTQGRLAQEIGIAPAVFEPKAERKAAVYRRGSGCYFRLSVSGCRYEVAYFFI